MESGSGGGGELLPRRGPSSFISKRGDGRGGWRAAIFIVAVGLFERIGFVGVSANLITYLTGPLAMSTAAAAAGVNAWSGTVQVLPLVGALVADSRLGRYRALLIAGVLYLLVSTVLAAPPNKDSVHLQKNRQLVSGFSRVRLSFADRFHSVDGPLIHSGVHLQKNDRFHTVARCGNGSWSLRSFIIQFYPSQF